MNQAPLEICILAGGLGVRLGRDKARLKLGGITMLARIRATARLLDLRVRVLRRDRVPRCGPLGGVATALPQAQARAVLFLACDMPLVSVDLLRRLARASRGGTRAVFVMQKRRVGFPFVVPVESCAVVERQIATREFSVQALARALCARRLAVAERRHDLCNVNTPEDVVRADALLTGKG